MTRPDDIEDVDPGPSRGQCCKEAMKENLLLLLTILGVGLGILMGFLMRMANLSDENIDYFSFPGELFLRMLKCMILPLILCSIISALATLDAKTSGRLGGRAVAYYAGTTLIAVIIGIILVVSIHPGQGDPSKIERAGSSRRVSAADSFLDLIRNMFPDNIAQACFQSYNTRIVEQTKPNPAYMASNMTTPTMAPNVTAIPEEITVYTKQGGYSNRLNVLGIITFSIFFGVVLGRMGEKGKPLVQVFTIFNDCIMTLVYLIMWYSPIGIMFLIAGKIMKMIDPLKLVGQLGMYMVTVIVGLAIHGFIILPGLYLIFTRKNPFKYIAGIGQALVTAFGTASSSATLPVTIRCLEDKNGVDPRVARLVLPVGATINMDGTALYEAVASIFIAQVNGITLNFGQIVAVSVTATAASVGAAGIPSAGLITMVIVLTAVGLPIEDITLLFAIDWLLDRFRTATNVLGDSIGAGIIDHNVRGTLPPLDHEKYDEGMLGRPPAYESRAKREMEVTPL
ncbi:PREDICTED: excitatory amino acid transporter 1-like [Branchiostoma belcheri]|uniref:Amino acid transporter n=1 Tax=Branchiostoma belcheri TaxID=7741 RepID=A0A6P5A3C6_BRABE|nr:PREDICTED: excitatory amino acid transporter 1-like [Branchiostoma belcheri]XP_019640820.1 PREDICTED: excitatory amino acid transporter 1-like [Branchiostoma belcheri]